MKKEGKGMVNIRHVREDDRSFIERWDIEIAAG